MARFATNYEENAPITADANRICFSGFYARRWKTPASFILYIFRQ